MPAAALSTGTAAPPPTAATTALLVVDVAGKVRRPGLYRLARGSRVDDAVRAAGGVLAGVDAATVNLAARVSDGEQIVVGVTGVPPPGAGSHSGAATSPVDLNTASAEQLQTLPGVGPVLAQHILDWRTAHGAFATVDQLREVPGIGPAKLAAIRPLVLT
jgi:competence protein ComEA